MQILRFGFYRIHQSLVSKPLSLEKFWPLSDEKQEDEIIIDESVIEQIKKVHNMK